MAETEWVRNLKAKVLSPKKLTLSWSLDGTWDDLEQKVWCRNSGSESGEWAFEYDVHEEARSFTWTDCSPGQSYDFCVGARNAGGGWYYGYLYNVPMDAILSVSEPEVTPRSGNVKLSWEQNPDAELGRAELWYRDEAGSYSAAADATATGSSYTFQGLPGGRLYDFWIRQRYSESGYTDREVKGVWLPGLDELRWEYADDRTAVKLSWAVNDYLAGISGEGLAETSPKDGAWATVYWEDRSKPGAWTTVDTWIPATQTTYTVTGLTPGRAYRFCVRVRDYGYPIWHEGMWDNDLYTPYIDMPKLGVPNAASNVRADYSKAEGKVSLSWRGNESFAGGFNRPYERIEVTRRTDGAGSWEQVYAGEPCESFSEEVARGHSYQYRVRPWNQAGYGAEAPSNVLSVAGALAPLAVSGLRATLDSATMRVTVSWGQTESWERPIDEVRVYRGCDGGDFTQELGSVEAGPYIDQAPEGGHSYRYLVQPRNSAGWGPQSVSNAVEVPPARPQPPKGVTAEVSGQSATVSWEPADEGGAYATVDVYASANDGAWAKVGSVSGSASSWTGPVAANSCYRFRLRAANGSGESGNSEATGYVYTVPTAPWKPTAGRAASGIAVSWQSQARFADRQEVEPRFLDDLGELSARPRIPVGNGAARSAQDPAPLTDAAMYYRVRAGIAQGESEDDWLWSEWSPTSEPVMPSSAPNAPAIASPAAGEVCDIDQGDGPRPGGATISWRHNPTDGSALLKSQVEVSWQPSTGSKVAHTATVTGASELQGAFATRFCDLDELVAQHGDEVFTLPWKARVRTMGEASPEWSPWSEVSFWMRRRPTAYFEAPGASAELSEYPVPVKIGCDGHGFGVSSVELSVSDSEGNVVARGTFEGLEFSLGADFWQPRNGATYALTATVNAKSGLAGTASASVTAAFERPKASSLRIECDRERGWVSLTPHVNLGDGEGRRVERLDVWRVFKGESVLVARGISDGQQVVDRYAPLNREYSYILGAYSDQGVYAATEHPGMLECPYSFVYYGDEGIARGKANPTEQASYTRTRRTKVDYAGRKRPVVYDGGGEGETVTLGFTVVGQEEVDAFREAMGCPVCVVKTASGRVFHATVDVDVSPAYGTYPLRTAVSAVCEVVDGDAL